MYRWSSVMVIASVLNIFPTLPAFSQTPYQQAVKLGFGKSIQHIDEMNKAKH